MVKYRAKPKGHETGQVITTKSPYGSHADMVVELEELQLSDLAELRDMEDYETVCKDDGGCYITLKSRLDNGLADPNRYADRRFQL
tara:strand:- start:425 stop:682 length:258 start_codon:yes stop_codon:yes gene_type:complete